MSIQALNPAAIDASQLQAQRPADPRSQTNDAAATQAVNNHATPATDQAQATQESQRSRESREPSAAELDDAIGRVQDFFQNKARDLIFARDDDSGRTVVRVIDSQTDEVLRQFPSKEMLALAQSLDETQKALGLLVQSKA